MVWVFIIEDKNDGQTKTVQNTFSRHLVSLLRVSVIYFV